MNTGHLRSLTSLRFLAAALIACFHAAIQSSPDLLQPFAALRFGYLGVTFFFVLSGFVLVWSRREDERVSRFYRRRFARVWPLHALTLSLAIGLAIVGLIDQRGPAWSLLVNVFLLQAWVPDAEVAYSFNGVSWSLSAEAFFYAVFPLLYLASRRVGARAMIVLGVSWLVSVGLVAETAGLWWLVGVNPCYRVGEFVVGMGLGLLLRNGSALRVRPTVAVILLLGSYATAVMINRLGGGWLVQRPWLVALIVLPSVSLVLVAFATRDIEGGSGWLTTPLMVRLGQWSFALYMVHELVLRVARPAMLEHPWLVPVALCVAVGLSAVLYEWFERPVEQRLRGRPAPRGQLEALRR